MTPFAFGIGAGFGVAAYRHVAPVPDAAASVIVVVLVLGILAAWLGGRRHGQHQIQIQWQEQQQRQAQEQRQAQQQAVQIFTGESLSHVQAEGGPALAGSSAVRESTDQQRSLESGQQPSWPPVSNPAVLEPSEVE